MNYINILLVFLIYRVQCLRELREHLTVEEGKLVDAMNEILVKVDPKLTPEDESLVFGIICLEMDDSMTTITAKNFDIKILNKKDIYEKLTTLCRIPTNYVEFLMS